MGSSYDAFLSYNHAADDGLAPALRQTLSALAKPWYRRHALRVFVDKASLSASPGLWPKIEESLDRSSHYVLLASPAAAASKWVNKELEHWLANKPADRILLVLTEGEIVWDDDAGDFDFDASTAIPEGLRGAFASEPLHTDLRAFKRGGDIGPRNPEFRSRVAEIAAAIHGVSKDQIVGDDLIQHRRVVRIAWSVGIVLFLLATTAAAMAVAASRARDDALDSAAAERQAKLAERSAKEKEIRARTKETEARQAESDARQAEEKARVAAEANLSANYVSNARGANREIERLLYAARAVDLTDDPVARGELCRALAGTPPLLWTVPPGGGEVTGIAFLPDGARFVTSSGDGTLRIWNRRTRAEIAVLAEPRRNDRMSIRVNERSPEPAARKKIREVFQTVYNAVDDPPQLSLAVSPDGTLAAVGRVDGAILLWDLDKERLVTRIGADSEVLALAFHPEGGWLASGSAEGTLQLWKLPNGRPGKRTQAAVSGFWGLAFSPDGRKLYALGGDGRLLVRDGATLAALDETQTAGPGPGTLALSPDGRQVVTSAATGEIEIWATAGLAWRTALTGHQGFVKALAFSPDSATLYSAGHDREIRAWDLATRRERARLAGHGEPVLALAVEPHGGELMSAGLRTLRVWNPDRAGEVARLEGHPAINGVGFDPQGAWVATASVDGQLRILAADTGRVLRRWPAPDGCSSVAVSTDGSMLATSGKGAVSLWKSETGALLRRIDAGAEYQFGVALSHDGSMVSAGGRDGVVGVWDVRSGRTVALLRGHEQKIASTAFHPRRKSWLVSGGADKTVRVWNVSERRQLHSFTEHEGMVRAVGFLAGGAFIASGGDDAKLHLFNTDSGEHAGSISAHTIRGSPLQIGVITFAPCGDFRIVTGGADNLLVLWDIARLADGTDRDDRILLHGHGGWVMAVAARADGSRIVSAGRENAVSLWDSSRLFTSGTVHPANARVTTVAYAPDGSRFAAGTEDGEIVVHGPAGRRQSVLRLNKSVHSLRFLEGSLVLAAGLFDVAAWRVDGEEPEALFQDGWGIQCLACDPQGRWFVAARSGKLEKRDLSNQTIEQLGAHQGVQALAVSPDGTLLASAGADRTVALRTLAAPSEPLVADLHTLPVRCLAFAPSSQLLASAGDDGTIRLWSRALEPRGLLEGHRGAVTSIAFSSDGRWLVSGGEDDSVRIWAIEEQREAARLLDHGNEVRGVRFHPSRLQVLTGSADGTSRFWELEGLEWPRGECLERAQNRCGHTLVDMDVRRRPLNRFRSVTEDGK